MFILNFIIGYLEYKKYYDKKILFFILNILSLSCYFFLPKYIFYLLPLVISQILIDFKKLELSDINNLVIFINGLIYSFYTNHFEWKSLILLTLIYLIIFLLPTETIGFGDVKLIFAIALFVPIKCIILYIFYPLLIALFIGFFYYHFKKSKEFPMGPCILLYFIISNWRF